MYDHIFMLWSLRSFRVVGVVLSKQKKQYFFFAIFVKKYVWLCSFYTFELYQIILFTSVQSRSKQQ